MDEVGRLYLNGPDGLEEREVLIFDKLTDIKGYISISIAMCIVIVACNMGHDEHVLAISRRPHITPRQSLV
jgi:hypothetical protein